MVRLIALVLLVALTACSRGASEETPPSDAPTGAVPSSATDLPPGAALTAGPVAAPVPADLPAVVARINGDEIRKADFEKALRNLERRAGSVPDNERDRVYRQVLEELIAYRLLLQESRARKVAVEDADVEARFGALRQQFPSEEAFKRMLTEQNLTVDQARAEMRDELRVAKLLETEIGPKISVQESDVSAFYEQNPSEFQQSEMVRASHILVSPPSGADAATRSAARQKAMGVLTRARSGDDFAALAREFSQDPGSAASGGDLGAFGRGDMVGPFSDVAFGLAPGAISDLVETEFGYHIIKVVEKQPARTIPLDEARISIQRHLHNMSRLQHTQAFVQALLKKGAVDILF